MGKKYRITFGEGSSLCVFREENVKVFDLRKKFFSKTNAHSRIVAHFYQRNIRIFAFLVLFNFKMMLFVNNGEKRLMAKADAINVK